MTKEEIESSISDGILHSLKLKIFSNGSAGDQYTVLHPYLLIDDLIEGLCTVGMIEEQYGQPVNTIAKSKLSSFNDVIVTDEKFEIPLRTEYLQFHDPQRDSVIHEVSQPNQNPG